MSRFLTVVLRLPSEVERQSQIERSLAIGSEVYGAVVTGVSETDEISVVEQLEELCTPLEVRTVRAYVSDSLRVRATGG
jgi:hypothetical protein